MNAAGLCNHIVHQNNAPVCQTARARHSSIINKTALSSHFLRFRATVIHYLDAFFHSGVNAIGIETILGQQ